jgi:hypothetical protein
MRVVLFFALILSMVAPSCKKYDPAPAAFHVVASPVAVSPAGDQGSASHNISDLWLYVNGQFQGAYPSSSPLPILSHGKTAGIDIFAGIKNNGISSTRTPWPFYNVLHIDTLAPAGSTLTLPLNFTYNSTATFTWTEDFDESLGLTLRKSDLSDTTYSFADPSEAFEGKSIVLSLDGSDVYGQLESSGSGFALPAGNSNVYLELNYKCNHEFSVGLIGDDQFLRPAITINPQQEWNKIYIQLATAVNSPETSSRYKVYFRMVRSASGEAARFFLDNIKLVYL